MLVSTPSWRPSLSLSASVGLVPVSAALDPGAGVGFDSVGKAVVVGVGIDRVGGGAGADAGEFGAVVEGVVVGVGVVRVGAVEVFLPVGQAVGLQVRPRDQRGGARAEWCWPVRRRPAGRRRRCR